MRERGEQIALLLYNDGQVHAPMDGAIEVEGADGVE